MIGFSVINIVELVCPKSIGLLAEFSETRDEVVARAREKVANGVYLTRPSAEASAEAFLRSV